MRVRDHSCVGLREDFGVTVREYLMLAHVALHNHSVFNKVFVSLFDRE